MQFTCGINSLTTKVRVRSRSPAHHWSNSAVCKGSLSLHPWKSTHSWSCNWICLKQQSGVFFRSIHTCERLKVAADVNVKTEQWTQAIQVPQCVEK